MALSRIVDAVDDWLLENVHSTFGSGARTGCAPGAEREPGPGLAGHRRARDEVRAAAAGLLFLRNKLEAEQTERRVRMARACHAILRAAREDDDDTALPLLAYRDVLRRRIRHAEEELAGIRTQIADATEALGRLTRAIERIETSYHRHRGPRRAGAMR